MYNIYQIYIFIYKDIQMYVYLFIYVYKENDIYI